MRKHAGTIAALVLLLGLAGTVGWQVRTRLAAPPPEAATGDVRPVAVEVAAVERGMIQERRVLTGTLEAASRFDVAPKVGGRIDSVTVDLGDPVDRGQVVAVLDDDELVQTVAQSRADLAVAEANRAQAQSQLGLAQREYERAQQLRDRGVATDAQIDEVETSLRAAEAAVSVAEAQIQRARSTLELAQIRLGHTSVSATWPSEQRSGRRFVAERYLDGGDSVQVGTPIVSVVELDPLRAVVFVTERDYAKLRVGQRATLRTDAYPGEAFEAEIVRLAPVFREASRQARVELRVANPELRLKPGMFVRVELVLREVDDAAIVPLGSLVRRDGRDVVFVLLSGDDGDHVLSVPVEVGIVDGERAQVLGEGIEGTVVTLGQQLLQDGSPVTVARTGEALPAAGNRSVEVAAPTGDRRAGGAS